MENSKIIALLIDAENVSPKYIKTIINEVSMYGTPSIRRIYGDWTSVEMGTWKRALNENNLQPMQQFSYTQGKNASDSALIIDAMDLLYAKNVDGFCLVSSDSDFTRLAARLRENRMFVIGMGESKTPTAFKAACDIFKYLDVLLGARKDTPPEKKTPPSKKGRKKAETEAASIPSEPHHDEELAGAFVSLEEIVSKIKEILDVDSDESGYMPLSQVGIMISRIYADFDSRNYGFSKLHKLIDNTGAFELKYETFASGGKNLVIRNKE